MNKIIKSLNDQSDWIFLVLGAIIGLGLAILIFKPAYCFYAFQQGGTLIVSAITAVAGLLTVVTSFLPEERKNKFKIKRMKKYIYLVSSLFFIGALVILASPLIHQYDKNTCTPDFDKLVGLTDQEGSAVLHADLDAIKSIYTSDAIVTDIKTNESWPAYTYYANKFVNEEHCTDAHANYDVVSFSTDEVVMTTSSQGTYGPKGQGCNITYDNPAGSDQWTFENIQGNWKIMNFEFNRK
jgi:hypothetical protein